MLRNQMLCYQTLGRRHVFLVLVDSIEPAYRRRIRQAVKQHAPGLSFTKYASSAKQFDAAPTGVDTEILNAMQGASKSLDLLRRACVFTRPSRFSPASDCTRQGQVQDKYSLIECEQEYLCAVPHRHLDHPYKRKGSFLSSSAAQRQIPHT